MKILPAKQRFMEIAGVMKKTQNNTNNNNNNNNNNSDNNYQCRPR